MKRFLYISPLIIFLFFSLTAISQRTFTEEELAVIDHNVDSVMQRYLQLSQFFNEYTFNTLSDEYLEAFPGLFSSPSVLIVNDLDPTNSTPKKITPGKYIEYVKEWYPFGLNVELTTPIKQPPFRYNDPNYFYTVSISKTLQGMYKKEEIWRYEGGELFFTIEFDDQLTSFRIASIDQKELSDTCMYYRNQALSHLSTNSCKNAKNAYINLLKFCPSDPEASAGLLKCDSCIDANKKPLFLIFHVLPGSSGIKLDGNDFGLDISSVSGFNFGLEAGIGLELAVLKSKIGILSVGLMIDYASYSGTSTLKSCSNEMDSLRPIKTDIDNDTYELIYIGNSLQEEDKLTSIQVPIYVQYQLSLSKVLSLYVKAGGKFGFIIGNNYKSSGTFTYKGIYGKYGGVILYDLPDYYFGTGPSTLVDESYTEGSSLNLSAFGGLGITMALSKKLELFIGADYTYGFSDIGNGEPHYFISEGKNATGEDQINSLFGTSKVRTQSLGVEVGVKWKIFKY